MTDRLAWSEFICASERAGRHLASIGRQSSGAFASVAIDRTALQDFLDRIDDDRATELLAQFLDLTMGGYLSFVETTLHPLLDALSSEKLGELVTVGPGPRGAVQWGRTVVARRTGGLAPGRYVSKLPHRSFDLPINRVLAWLVADLSSAMTIIKRAVRSQHLSPALERMDVLLQEASGHHWLAAIEPSPNVEIDISLARIDLGKRAYAEVLRLARRRQKLADRNLDQRWQQVLDLLAVGWLEPLDDDDLFELYALVLTMDVLENDLDLGAPVAVDLVRPGRREVARFAAGDRSVSVYFDQSYSAITGSKGRYPVLTSGAPLISSHPRRPDITVTVSDENGIQNTILIEVKNTLDANYVSASIYRCYGYIHDFTPAGLFSSEGPACVLMVNGAIGAGPMLSDELVVIDGTMREALAQALRAALSI